MAAKGKMTVFYCQSCGNEYSKWSGQCPACKAWNTLVEEVVDKAAVKNAGGSGRLRGDAQIISLSEVDSKSEDRISTGIGELDRVLGGGIVNGSLTLIGGDPGIGKSTLLLQMCREIAAPASERGQVFVLYVSGEESQRQIRMRADRIGSFDPSMKLLCETNLDLIAEAIRREKPSVVVIDSIQTMYNEAVGSAPGSVSQVRESTNVLMQLAKGLGISIFIVGHMTKEGAVAGPRVLEHMVDTVLYFEGDRHASYRLLRANKNRFGSTDEIGVFEMDEKGLREVENPSSYMLDGRPEGASGSVVSCCMEGTRPLLLELQALVTRTNFGFPRRQSVGADLNRVNLLMAVLEKQCGIQIGDHDAYVNITGGVKLSEPALDLGIVLAITSSFKGRPIDPKTVVFGEVGLSGEVRSVPMARQRVAEAGRLGFDRCIVPKGCDLPSSITSENRKLKIVGVASVEEAIEVLF